MVFVVCAAKVGAAPSLRVFAWFSLAACSAGFKLAHSKSESRLVTANTDTDTDSEYTDNYLCHQNYCINPLFVGLYDLSRLETSSWQCSSRSDVLEYSTFCKDALYYAPALPDLPDTSYSENVSDFVRLQDKAAVTMFAYHLSGMGYEYMEHASPWDDEDLCVQKVYNQVCYTYFPKASVGCIAGDNETYVRPCKSSCQNYINYCGVECCDESVQCVFEETVTSGDTTILLQGYVDETGPSALCTGEAFSRSLTTALLVMFGVRLSGAY